MSICKTSSSIIASEIYAHDFIFLLRMAPSKCNWEQQSKYTLKAKNLCTTTSLYLQVLSGLINTQVAYYLIS